MFVRLLQSFGMLRYSGKLLRPRCCVCGGCQQRGQRGSTELFVRSIAGLEKTGILCLWNFERHGESGVEKE